MLSLFFIYFLLISSDISTLNCTTGFLKDNHYMKHVILFASIFILTFILNWYSPESIVVEKKNEEEEEKEGFITLEGFKYGYLISSVLNSVFIYLIFLITTKIDANHFGIFVSLLIFVFVIF